ncbi:MAG TPA: hypothetical protein VG984_00145 [Candidatus Paceibacterota bacterium]|nr:hypothetical protein [Candidatus Paceibacterota bacterium]
MKVSVFVKKVRLEEKLRLGEPLTADEEEFAKEHPLQQPKRCGICGGPMEPRVDGEHHAVGMLRCD